MNKRHIFLDKVIEQVKSKDAKDSIKLEMEHHIQLAKEGWIKKGLQEKEAEERAIKEMGSPILLGLELNKLHRLTVDWMVFACTVCLLMIGLLPNITSDLLFIAEKLWTILLGVGIVVGIMFLDYRKCKELGYVFYMIGSILLLSVILFSNITINGINYLKVGPIIIKGIMAIPFFLLAWASLFTKKNFSYLSFLLFFFFSSILFYLGYDSISTVFIYYTMVVVMLFWSSFSKKQIVLSIVTGAVLFILLFGYAFFARLHRLLGFLFPDRYAQDVGWIYLYREKMWASLKWIGSSDMELLSFVNRTDTVFLQLSSQFGYVIAVVIVILFSALIIKMIRNVRYIKNRYGKLLLIGAIALYSIQVIYNIGMCMGLFPIISLSLPFISYGLMPTIINALLIGLVLSINRRKNIS
ncbi:FtsW/RodA/SpoVE family cell cycle protein [Niallia sp. Sow4_A1]|uniref:FtsW/RodA/SpoVE family cell cycle protein n=1 Tax=Niallia sp. Sow4_A1 TaxID=3438793 RepID=UPI003F9DF620